MQHLDFVLYRVIGKPDKTLLLISLLIQLHLFYLCKYYERCINNYLSDLNIVLQSLTGE